MFAPVSGNCLATDAFWWVVSRVHVWVEGGGGTHVKVRGEGVEDLVGAHVGVGVDDTLAAALHVGGCEIDGGECEVRVDCALAPPSSVGWTGLGRDS